MQENSSDRSFLSGIPRSKESFFGFPTEQLTFHAAIRSEGSGAKPIAQSMDAPDGLGSSHRQ